MLPAKLQKLNLLVERPFQVKVRAVENCSYVGERELQLPEEHDLLQPRQVFVAVEPVARLAAGAWPKQTSLVVVVQRPHAHVRELADFMHGSHETSPSLVLGTL